MAERNHRFTWPRENIDRNILVTRADIVLVILVIPMVQLAAIDIKDGMDQAKFFELLKFPRVVSTGHPPTYSFCHLWRVEMIQIGTQHIPRSGMPYFSTPQVIAASVVEPMMDTRQKWVVRNIEK